MLHQIIFASMVGLALSVPSKIDSKLQQVLGSNGAANIVVSFRHSTETVLDTISSMEFETRGSKINTMMDQLKQLTTSSQKDVIALLQGRSISYKSFWINNRVFIKGVDASLVDEISSISDVSEVREEIIVHLDKLNVEKDIGTRANGWNILKIQAEKAWADESAEGSGIVVASIDTGVQHTHEALAANYKPGANSWKDGYAPASQNPVDDSGHGTHVMGTIVGAKGIGVAPKAQWITCRGCKVDTCTEEALTICGEWITCPDVGTCNEAPDIVSNSWGSAPGDSWYRPIVRGWRDAGIVPVFSIGNGGEDCGVTTSPGDLSSVIAVGSTDINDQISSFSGRGPTLNEAIKPDITAPGQSIRSAWIDPTDNDIYAISSGTSMSTPHISGTIALMMSAKTGLTYEQIKTALFGSTFKDAHMEDTSCGGDAANPYPNGIYGHGRVDALEAVKAAKATKA